MTPTWEIVGLAFSVGASIPVLLWLTYWLAVDEAKRQIDRKLREAR